MQNGYLVQEPTLNGLMAYLGLRTAAELHNTTGVSTDDQQACAFSVGYGGFVSTDTTSAFSVLESCRNYVTPYKLAIAPDSDFTRKYFFEAVKTWYPRVVVDAAADVALPSLEDSVVFFDSEDSLESYIGKVGYGKSFETPIIYAALVFDEYPEDEDIGTYQSIEYSVRMNSTLGRGGSSGAVPRTLGDPAFEAPFQRTIEQTYYTSYASQGFMTLQTLVARFVNCMPAWDTKTKSTTGICTQKLSIAVNSTENDARLFHAVDGDVLLNAGLSAAFGSTGTTWQTLLSTAAKEQLLEHASAQTYTIMTNFLLGVVLMVVSFILDVVSDSSSDANKVLKFFWRLSPLFNLGSALLNQCLSEIGAAFGRTSEPISPFKMDVMGWELLYLALDSIIFFTIAVGIDFLLSFPKIKAAIFKDPVLKDAPYEEDEDVAREAERVRNGGADGDAVKLLGIRKVYKGNKVAVRNLSFGLPKGECFGYLGINGAGKTTTMKMMTGDILPTSGSGTLGGFDILSEQLEVRRLIGYCPQFDALFELMTVREHLELFARIKGVARADLNNVVKSLMHQMNLDDFENKLAGTLSGGNKRKLSVAIALIGSPPIIFLDEPSTGMDPVSRRFMWNVIAAISTQRKESTIILTTHSMEECEALCTRVGIMVGGRLRCLGSVQHLKHRFGDGLMLELKLKGTPTHDIAARVASVFGGSAPTTTFPREELRAKCEALGDASWADKVVMNHATGYALAAALERDGTLRLGMLCAWWAAEERFLSLDEFLRESFAVNANTGVKLLERQNDLCRYKLTGQVPRLASVFRCVEGSKQQLGIREYAVSQTTLEQIFNNFAGQQSEEKGVARGIGG
ncbi:hypothetical protein AM588_10007506 [Phytophthora nicotianae]|uniref:ABC transporter domain-containing protein n=1 Tax=Phytophthora nicotianae TaxID=4792 RepID=A0A0W8DA46_PHYNI|nr:hypothetical protein AM588_10007506 [Phytophthora nicotianae]